MSNDENVFAVDAPWGWREKLGFWLMPNEPCPLPDVRWRPEDVVVCTTIVSLSWSARLRVLLTGHLKVQTRTVTEFMVGATKTASVAYPVWKP